MDFIKPRHPTDLVERIKREYPVNCLGCEHLRALPDKTALCLYGGRPRKVDVLDPTMTNRECKYTEATVGTGGGKGPVLGHRNEGKR